MSNRKLKITFSIVVTLVLIFSCSRKTTGLKKSDVQPVISLFLNKHVQFRELNDELSRRTFNNILRQLDPGKQFFYKSDIAALSVYENKIDDFIEKEKYDFLSEIYSVYRKRFAANIVLIHELLKGQFDFTIDESVTIDPDAIDYVSTDAEMRERWRKSIKLQLLNYLDVINDMGKAKEKIVKRYQLFERRVNEVDEAKMMDAFANAFSTALDPHSNYLSPEDHEDFMIQTKLKLEGIGVMLRSEDGFVTVESIVPTGAAAKLPVDLQLKLGDKIIGVSQGDGEMQDVIDRDLRDVVRLIRGKKNTEVRLKVVRRLDEKNKQQQLIIPIKREEIKLETSSAKSEVYVSPRPAASAKIGYIRLPTFYFDFDAAQSFDKNTKSSFHDFRAQLASLKKSGVDGIVIDLRGNPGGALNEAVYLTGLFIDTGPVVQVKDGNNNISIMRDDERGMTYDGPIVVLIDGFSASASEIFAGAIRDYRRGLILGPTKTFGKGSVQNYLKLADGAKGAVKITTALFYQPVGTSNDLIGINPDIIVPDISAVWDIGEHKLKYTIKWEKIPSAPYKPYTKYLNGTIVSQLISESNKRVSSSKKFADLIQRIKKLKAKVNAKSISLKKEDFSSEEKDLKEIKKKMRDENDKKLIDLERDLFLQEAFDITTDYIRMLKR